MRSLLLVALVGLSTLSSAKNLSIGGKVGMAKEGSSYVPTTSLTADYRLSDYISGRGEVGARLNDGTKVSDASLQIPVNLLIHPLGKSGFDPYVGPGGNFSSGNGQKGVLGFNGVAGFMVNAGKKQGFGLEFRYLVADYNTSSKGQLEGSLLGKWETKF